MKRSVLVLCSVAAAVLAWATVRFGGPQGPSFEEVKHLKDVRIVPKEPRVMLACRATAATPKEVVTVTIPKVFSAYGKLFGFPNVHISGRWWILPDGNIEGQIGVEIPEASMIATARSSSSSQVLQDLGVTVEEWVYGTEDTVAEVLHVGSYSEEKPTIETLKSFVAAPSSLYDISEPHEEEYLRGPGMLFSGDSATYLTIIRYPVVKRK